MRSQQQRNNAPAAAAAWALFFYLASPLGAADVTVRVDCQSPTHKISPRLVGAFFEDINFGGDGGLCAELVKNGSLEVPQAMLGWKPIGDGVTASVEHEAPVSAGNPTYLRLRVDGGARDAGVVNEGFRGMGVHEGATYRLSFLGRSTAGREAKVTARLVGADGGTLAEHAFTVEGSAWREHGADLVPPRTEEKARLELVAETGRDGLVDLDVVSLCPADTWMGRPHGLRADIVQLLADLEPTFFRFPGGCIVEGSELKYRYGWKTTVGPRDERRLIINRWNTEFSWRPAPDYYQSFALGFFEYFQLSEDLGAEPLPIINCGMACQFNTGELVPLEELEPFIQDALDLIEFANGPIDSEWGSVRAAMGHPEPFNMRLLGVGNEQWGPPYFERYERFAEALQREHPEIELISTSGPFPSGEHFDYAWPLLRKMDPAPIVDEHCYAMPDWFLREAHRFDDYDRDGPKVFMGEYAAQSVQIASPRNRNTLRCALAEAAFLTGVERNSDVVTMTAYAPLLAHKDAWQWRPDLIWFDNLTSFATPNYYVQKLFGQHTGDAALAVEVDDQRPPRPEGGRFGFGAHNATAEFRNIRVESADGATLHNGALSTGDLIQQDGDWDADGEVVRNTSRGGTPRALFGDPGWGDATFTCQACKRSGREGFSVFFRCGAGGSRIEWVVGGWNNQRHGIDAKLATHYTTETEVVAAPGSIESDRWYDVRVETHGSRVRCYLDGELVHDVVIEDPAIDRVFASASVDEATGETIVKLVNPTDDPTEVQLALNGAGDGPLSCKVIELSGAAEGENTFDDPKRIFPKESEEQLDGVRVLPPHSLSVLRIATGGSAP